MAAPPPATAKSVAELEQDAHLMDRYSRQIGAFGMDAMLKLVQTRVLFIGVRGVGVETAKNTVLAGARQVTLYDPDAVTLPDLGANFFLHESDVGKPRAAAVAPRLAELNPLVKVEATSDALDEDLVARHDAVIVTSGLKQSEIIRWNEFCRSRTKKVVNPENPADVLSLPNPITFIRCFTAGAAGSVFVDHGPGFVVKDADGKEPLVKIITGIEQREETVALPDGTDATNHYTLLRYLTPDGQPPGSLRDNCLIGLTEVAGMQATSETVAAHLGSASINGAGPFRTWTRDGDPVNTVRIGDTRGLSPYLGGGVLAEIKEHKPVRFRSLADCIVRPATSATGVISDPGDQGFVMIDMMSQFAPGGIEQQMHVALQGVYSFEEKHGRLPECNNDEEEEECVSLAKTFNDTLRATNSLTPNGGRPAMVLDEVDEKVMRRVARYAAAELQPMCAFFGGVVAQELVKMSGKFTPIQQYFNYHVFGALPDDDKCPTDTAPLDGRYDHQIAVFGRAFQERIGNLRIFMVGCGALGCEYAKNFALMGVACGPKGMLHITDNDRIEVSNLSRQFLFREDNVGQPKSVAASQRALVMNKDMKINARQDLVGADTEHIFDDAFWDGLDLVCNALDNMPARFYVDGKCVFYEKPLLESGTMGTGANVDVVVPHKTRSYADGGNADEGGGIPMCTLRNFPHLIDHCIEWSRAKFTDLFVSPAQQLQMFLDDPYDFLEKLRAETLDKSDPGERANAIAKAAPRLRLLKSALEKAGSKPTIEDCVALAQHSFYELFRDNILDLIDKFPHDAKTSSGDPFWSGHKKFPQALEYDPSDEVHVAYIMAAANLFACMLKVHPAKHPSEQNKLNAERWMAPYRDASWLNKVVNHLEVPEYHRGAVADLDDETGAAADEDIDDEPLVAELEAAIKEMEAAAAKVQDLSVEPLDFEKDDDDNFHIDFIAACANLRAVNYKIPTTTRHKCKMIAGRIIPAIATATASVTGLVMMEMLKVLQDKPIETLRNGNYDIGTNTYMMFEADPPKQIKSRVIKTKDEVRFKEDLKDYGDARAGLEMRIGQLEAGIQALELITAPDGTKEAFEKELKQARDYMSTLEVPDLDDYGEEEKIVAYPDPHDKWMKLRIPTSVETVEDMVDFFKKEHNLTMQSWSMSKRTEDGKVTGVRLFPPEATLDPSLLPAASESMATASRSIMTNAKIPGNLRQKYIQAWRQLRDGGEAPSAKNGEDGANASVKRTIQDRTGMDLSKRSRLLLEGVGLANADGENVTTAAIILEL